MELEIQKQRPISAERAGAQTEQDRRLESPEDAGEVARIVRLVNENPNTGEQHARSPIPADARSPIAVDSAAPPPNSGAAARRNRLSGRPASASAYSKRTDGKAPEISFA